MGLAGAGLTTLPVTAATAATGAVQSRPASAPLPVRRSGKLSPRLSELARVPSLFSSSNVASVLGLARSGGGSLVRKPGGKLLVQIRTSNTSTAGVARLQAMGARTVNVSAAYSTVTASVTPATLAAIAADPNVIYVSEVLAPFTAGIGAGARAALARPATNTCNPTIPEGDSLMNVATARSANNLDGAGQTIGVLSDSFDTNANAPTTEAQDIATGDLPGAANPCGYTTPVKIQSDYSDPPQTQTDEGRGMAELAHAMAPAANLAFASGSNGELDFASQINTLRTTNHATVLVDDLTYLDEPFFQDGPVANAASAAGVPYFSAAGNSNVIVGGHNVGSYETPAYRNTTCPSNLAAQAGEQLLGCHNFDPNGGTDNADEITVASGGGFIIDLQWAQPWGAVSNDYDLFVLSSSGTLLDASETDNPSFGEPVEAVAYFNQSASSQTVKIVIGKYSGGADSRMKFLMFGSGGITGVQHNVSNGGDIVGPTIFGHSGAATVGSTAAINYNDSTTPEFYSSRGPVTHYFQPTPSTTALGSPAVIAKPDIAATDDVQSKFGFIESGVRRFAGTSAAAPQAAGIGALLEERDPALNPAEIMSTLSGTARAVANNGTASDVGGGYLDAAAALASVVPFPGVAKDVTAADGDTQSQVQWAAAPSNPNFPITSYVVTPTKDGVAQAPIDTGTGTPGLLVTGLTNGSTYTFTVAAVNANGTGAESDPSSAIDLDVPDPPSAVVAVPGDGQAQVSWTAPPASGITITGYEVTPFSGGAAQSPQSFSSPATTQTITGLANGTQYEFKVAAVDAFATGPQSDFSPPVFVGAPVAPAAPTFTYNGTTVPVSWAPPASDNGSPITGYNVESFGNGGSVHSFGASTTTWNATGLSSGYPYTFEVQAVNANGVGPYSPASQSVTPGTPVALAPPTPKISGNGSATLSWHAPASGPAADGYQLNAYVGADVAATVQFNSTATSQVFTGLTNGTSYRFTVAGVDGFGVGQESALSTPFVVGLPAAPTNLTDSSGNASARVHWTAGSNHGSAITGYVVTPYYGSTAQTAHTFHSTATTETVTGLVNGRAYTFKVAAINAPGTGPKSSASPAVRVGTPGAPTSVQAWGGAKSAKVHWVAPPSNGASITAYVITPYLGSTAQPVHTFNSSATTEIVHGLTSGHTYTFKVAAVNSRGTGAKSNKSNAVSVT